MLRHLPRTIAVVALALAPALAGPASAATPSGACPDGDGVTVVVDATELGGDVEIGCADAPSTGTEALTQAGFVDTRDGAGMICAISGLPDPCPATFEGSYWSYWYAEDGTWQAYMEGSDTAVPSAGGVEGWRWSDGTVAPDVDLAALTGGAADGATAAPTAEPAPSATATVTAAEDDAADEGGSALPLVLAAAAVVAVALAALVVRRRKA